MTTGVPPEPAATAAAGRRAVALGPRMGAVPSGAVGLGSGDPFSGVTKRRADPFLGPPEKDSSSVSLRNADIPTPKSPRRVPNAPPSETHPGVQCVEHSG